MTSKMRLDLLMFEKKLVSSRTKAQDLIQSGNVWYQNSDAGQNSHWIQAQNASEKVNVSAHITIKDEQFDLYVSRGGLKLAGALEKTKITLAEKIALDVGLSTGGFSDCLLQNGIKKIVGVDVGTGQLHSKLQNNEKLISLESLNARDLKAHARLMAHMPAEGFDVVVVDVSFISLNLILPSIDQVLKNGGTVLALVKPQFEVGPQGLAKGGLVKDPELYTMVEDKVRKKCLELGWKVRDYFNSPIEGKDGNKEFFIWAEK